MGSLKPGATYIYEKADGVTYAREFGADPSERFPIGWDYMEYDNRTSDGRPLHEHLKEQQLWGNIHRAARTNPALQKALEQVKMLYYLSKEDAKHKR